MTRSQPKRADSTALMGLRTSLIAVIASANLSACTHIVEPQITTTQPAVASQKTIHPELWPIVQTPPLDPAIEARIDAILAKLTLEQKIGQVIQADSAAITPEEVKRYRLGSILSGGNSAPGPLPYADTRTWLTAADEYYLASVDAEGVEIAIPIIWGIDAVHGHANLQSAVIFPHNIGLGAANNPDLIEQIARVTARQLTVSGHDWTFAPTLAVPQNDGWGRTYEGFSESPEIVASYGERIVYGLQGRVGEPGFMGTGRVIPSAKHFLGDGGTQNGVDQGDARISEKELRDLHGAGYVTAVAAGAQTVMASFSSWQGQRMHGQKALLTDVLKGRMNFKGFIVGDWNGHGLIPGCTTIDCPAAMNAGLDMYMAPDSWKGLWESTLIHAQSGEIPMTRLDDAVRRILRVKAASGILDTVRPSQRELAGDTSILGSEEHRVIARQAVRESLVLLKNQNGLLPLDAGITVLVIGDGADSISKAAGGWTLSWQGGGYANSDFPNGQSILSGISDVVNANGGKVIFDPTGQSTTKADVVIAIFGEDPYAEFQGDVDHVDFTPNGFDTARLKTYQEVGTPVVSVFLSGRPLWVNPELNASDAFVAAWLPGSEGGGVADLLFQTKPEYDFTGRLSFSWPKQATDTELNVHDAQYDPLFALGFGLTYASTLDLMTLTEVSGLSAQRSAPKGVFFEKGSAPYPWALNANGSVINDLPFNSSDLIIKSVDKEAQEDSLQIAMNNAGASFALSSSYAHDFEREANGAMELVFEARSISGDKHLSVGMGCESTETECTAFLPVTLSAQWQEYRLTLSCFADAGVMMSKLNRAYILDGSVEQTIELANVRIEADTNGTNDCSVGSHEDE